MTQNSGHRTALNFESQSKVPVRLWSALPHSSRRHLNSQVRKAHPFFFLIFLFNIMNSSLVDGTNVAALQPDEVQQQHADNNKQKMPQGKGTMKSSGGTNNPSKSGSAAPARKTTHDKDRQLALARASAARKRAAKERGEIIREPAAKGLILPYRAIRRIMKIDKDNSTIQIEAAIIATKAAELFVQKMAKESHKHAKEHGRNGIKYEDIAETRASNPNMSFLDVLLP